MCCSVVGASDARPSCCASSSSTRGRLGTACRSPPTRPTSTPSPPTSSRRFPATARSSGASRASSAGTRWRWWSAPTRHSDGIGGHISTYASAATLYEVGFNHFFRGKDERSTAATRSTSRATPRPGIYARAFLEGRLSASTARELPPRAAAGRRAVLLPAPLADARLLGVPDRLDGPRADHGHLPGALQPLPGGPRPEARARPQGVGLPRRRRDRRAGVARRHHAWPRARSSTT